MRPVALNGVAGRVHVQALVLPIVAMPVISKMRRAPSKECMENTSTA